MRDRAIVRQIAWDTALSGRPASIFFGDKEVLQDLLTLYFTDYEPESCFVAESGGRVIGYLIGCLDSRKLDRASLISITPGILLKIILRGTILNKKNRECLWRFIASFLKGEFICPDLYGPYPATMHINIAEDFRQAGAGTQLVSEFFKYLRKNSVRGVRLATYSPDAGRFFEKQGFRLLFSKPRTYFSHVVEEKMRVYVYAEKLGDASGKRPLVFN
ncbi:MAG: GNAT family N-acetyltransferase [Candidatus Omnitrophica bacterium]|jgi:GNAT superfamily N-acetyltransferase|nr:GNAT family N-acetyltransferase [Candidatus Omnitrophota bacterium]